MVRRITSYLISIILLAFAVVISQPAFALTDEEEAAKNGVKAPAEWVFPPHTPLRVLTVRGLWYQYFGVERALSRLGGAIVTESWHSLDSVRYYPEGYDGLQSHHLMVIGNVNGKAFGPVRRKMLKDYVENGGAVLFLGGKFAFGPQYHANAFEEFSPVTYAEKDDLVSAPTGAKVAAGPDILGKGFTALPWAAKPLMFWYHTVTPKPGAKVLLTADGKPLLITGTFGKGRVAVFAGSVMGDPQAGQLPLWEWDGWPAVLAETIKWLTEQSGVGNSTLSAAVKEKLNTRFLGAGVKEVKTLAPEIQQYAHLCGDKETAVLLLRAVANLEGDAPLDLVDEVSHWTRPFIDDSFADTATLLMNSGETNKISLALRLYGKMKSAQAKSVLVEALKTGDVASDEGEDLLGDGEKMIEDPKERAHAIRLGAFEGLGNLHAADEVAAINELVRQYRKTRQNPENFPKTITLDDELYQDAVIAALRCGDATASGPAIDAILQNRYLFVTLTVILDQPLEDPDAAESYKLEHSRIMRILNRVQMRHTYLTGKLMNLPDGVLPALAKRVADEEDPRVIPLAYAIFGKDLNGGRKLPDAAIAALKQGKLAAIVDLAAQE